MSQDPAVFPSMDVLGNQEVLEAAVAFIYDGIAKGKLTPVIGKAFPFDQIVEATRFMESNQHVGKVVVTV